MTLEKRNSGSEESDYSKERKLKKLITTSEPNWNISIEVDDIFECDNYWNNRLEKTSVEEAVSNLHNFPVYKRL